MGAIKVKLELNSKTRKDGRRIILLRLTHNKKMKRISTMVYVFPKDFNIRASYGNWVKKSDRQHLGKNRDLQAWIFKAESASMELDRKGMVPTLEKVKEMITIEETSDWFAYWEKVMKREYDTNHIANFKKYQNGYIKFKKFVGNKKLGFHDLTVSLLKDYEIHLTKLGNNKNTINKEFKIIRAVLYRAIRENLFPQEHNPFFKIKLSREKGTKAKLTLADVQQMEALELEEGSYTWHVRNFWLFSMYCAGIRFTDICCMKWGNVTNGRLEYVMSKTSVAKSVLLLDQSKTILNYYRPMNPNPDDLIFPLIQKSDFKTAMLLHTRISGQNAKVNRELKRIAKLAGIMDNLSFHVSRHTFADIARKKIGKSFGIYEISKMLGHSSIKVTENYLNSFDQDSVDEAMNSIFD